MERKREVYTSEKIDDVLAALKSMPSIEKRNKSHSKQEAVKILSKEILKLKKRGYEWDDIAAALKGEGIVISSATLKNYVQRAKKPPENREKTTPVSQTKKSSANKSKSRFTPSTDSDDI